MPRFVSIDVRSFCWVERQTHHFVSKYALAATDFIVCTPWRDARSVILSISCRLDRSLYKSVILSIICRLDSSSLSHHHPFGTVPFLLTPTLVSLSFCAGSAHGTWAGCALVSLILQLIVPRVVGGNWRPGLAVRSFCNSMQFTRFWRPFFDRDVNQIFTNKVDPAHCMTKVRT